MLKIIKYCHDIYFSRKCNLKEKITKPLSLFLKPFHLYPFQETTTIKNLWMFSIQHCVCACLHNFVFVLYKWYHSVC